MLGLWRKTWKIVWDDFEFYWQQPILEVEQGPVIKKVLKITFRAKTWVISWIKLLFKQAVALEAAASCTHNEENELAVVEPSS